MSNLRLNYLWGLVKEFRLDTPYIKSSINTNQTIRSHLLDVQALNTFRDLLSTLTNHIPTPFSIYSLAGTFTIPTTTTTL